MKTKLSDVIEIVDFPAIIQHPYDRSSRWKDVPVTLHIVDRQGKAMGRDFMGKSSLKSVGITRCNRVVEHWDSGTSEKVDFAIHRPSDVVEHNFCSRCGTKDDFVAVMKAWEMRLVKWSQDYRAEEEEKTRKAHERWDRVKLVTELNMLRLMEKGVDVLKGEEENEIFHEAEFNGRLYRFTIRTSEVQTDKES